MKPKEGSYVTTGSHNNRSDPRFRRFVLSLAKVVQGSENDNETSQGKEQTQFSEEQTGIGTNGHIPRPPSQQKYSSLATFVTNSTTKHADRYVTCQKLETETKDVPHDPTAQSLNKRNEYQNSDDTESSIMLKCEEPFHTLTIDEETDSKTLKIADDTNKNYNFQCKNSDEQKTMVFSSLADIHKCLESQTNEYIGSSISGVTKISNNSKDFEHGHQQSFSSEKSDNPFYNETSIHVNLIFELVPQPASLNEYPTLEQNKNETQVVNLHQDLPFHDNSFEADQENTQSTHRRPRRLPPLESAKNSKRQSLKITASNGVLLCHPKAEFCGSKKPQDVSKVLLQPSPQKTPKSVRKKATKKLEILDPGYIPEEAQMIPVCDQQKTVCSTIGLGYRPVRKGQRHLQSSGNLTSSIKKATYHTTFQEPARNMYQLEDSTADESNNYGIAGIKETHLPRQNCVSEGKFKKNGFPSSARHQRVEAVNSFPLMSNTTIEKKHPEVRCGENSILRKRRSTVCAQNVHALLEETKTRRMRKFLRDAEELNGDFTFVNKDNKNRLRQIDFTRRYGICDSTDFSFRKRMKTRAILKRCEMDGELLGDFLENATENPTQNGQLRKLPNSDKRLRRPAICDRMDDASSERMKVRALNKRLGCF